MGKTYQNFRVYIPLTWGVRGILYEQHVLDHRARNTIFTDLDYEYGFKSSDLVENESLSRILISSKTGLILLINYHTKKLENAFQIHDGPIQSISVNDAFCVTGSEDHLLRVWLLDFSEYFIEAPHDGTVSAVDISPDGTQIICGTNNGSLGMVDIAKEKYVTLLRSHSDEIIAADYNTNRNYIITVSKDKTIRLWGVDGNFQKIYEFVSPNDQAISVSSHPSLPLFGWGFESGTLRIFDIERTKVWEVYSQFNLPLWELLYSSDSRLLITAAKDGYLAIHNVQLQHQPIKMIPVDFPPPHVCIAFDPTNSVFGSFGDSGNYINIYDSVNFSLMNIVNIKKDFGKCFVFSPYKFELVVATTSCKIRFYDLKVKGGAVPTREICNAHRDAINNINFSINGHYFITSGNDKSVKIFDSEADKISPYYFQSFIGHTFAVEKAFFNPMNNGQWISVGGKDGIHLWNFVGDVSTNYNPPADEFLQLKNSMKYKLGEGAKSSLFQQMLEPSQENEQKELNEEEKQEVLADPSENKENVNLDNQSQNESAKDQINDDLKHYKDFKETPIEQDGQEFQNENRPEINDDDEFEHEDAPDHISDTNQEKKYYNGDSAHDNIIWMRNRKLTLFTSGCDIVVENSNTGIQTVFENGHLTDITALAISQDENLLASWASEVDSQGTAPIIIWDLTNGFNKIYELRSHEIGVKNILFSKDSAYLISQGVNEERSIIIWNIEDGLVIKSTICPTHYSGMTLIDTIKY